MRVLATCLPAPGHINPLLPLLTALGEQGDEVTVASGSDIEPRVRAADLAFEVVGTGFNEWFGTLSRRGRGQPGDGIPIPHVNRYWIARLFGEVASEDMVDGILDAAKRLEPDLLLFETHTFATPLVSHLTGIPQVHLQVGRLYEPIVLSLAADGISPLWRSFGLDYPELAGVYAGPTIRTMPRRLDPAVLPAGEPLQMHVVSPPAARRPAEPPLVHMTLGTAQNRDLEVFRAFIDSALEQPFDVLLTVGEQQDPRQFDPLPPNVTVERYVDHAELLPRCIAIVHQGGFGTCLAATAHGLPQVIVPQGADQFENADALTAAGVAVTLSPGEVTAGSVRQAVHEVVGNTSYGAVAADVAAEILAMPTPADVAAQLRERFAPR